MLIPVGDEIIFPELWYNLTSYEVPYIAPIYEISSWGRIYNMETKTLLPKDINYCKNKYITVRLKLIDDDHICVQPHRIMMKRLCPIPNSEFYDVNHKDGIKYHNWIWNLEWTTHKENMEHAVNSNLFRLGENRTTTKVTNQQVEQICSLIESGKTSKQIAEIMQLENCNCERLARNIRQHHCWNHISCNYNFPKRKCNGE